MVGPDLRTHPLSPSTPPLLQFANSFDGRWDSGKVCPKSAVHPFLFVHLSLHGLLSVYVEVGDVILFNGPSYPLFEQRWGMDELAFCPHVPFKNGLLLSPKALKTLFFYFLTEPVMLSIIMTNAYLYECFCFWEEKLPRGTRVWTFGSSQLVHFVKWTWICIALQRYR